MFGHKIKIDAATYEKLTTVAEKTGYSSTEEFILHTLEKAASVADEAESEEEVRKRLQGLGYLD
ncbi:MAG: hypothetical protein KJ626_08690 [Verrucomicrobia bacterium]|nr:hypothetical protein [Verrucomicrobiota bacterium]